MSEIEHEQPEPAAQSGNVTTETETEVAVESSDMTTSPELAVTDESLLRQVSVAAMDGDDDDSRPSESLPDVVEELELNSTQQLAEDSVNLVEISKTAIEENLPDDEKPSEIKEADAPESESSESSDKEESEHESEMLDDVASLRSVSQASDAYDSDTPVDFQNYFRRTSSFDRRQDEYLAMREAVRSCGDGMEQVIQQWRKLREEFTRMRENSCLQRDDGGVDLIMRRITEVGSMCSSTTRAEFFIASLPEECRDDVRKFTDMTPDEFKVYRRVGWTTMDYFRYALRMARLLCKAFIVRRKFNSTGDISENSPNKTMSERDISICSTGSKLRDCLLTNPIYRTPADRVMILRYLRSTKAFSHMLSSEMEEECARYISYEKYQDSRIIAYQNRPAEKFFYIISGKIEKIKDYELRKGMVQRSFGFIHKGETSDLETMESQKPRKHKLVSVGLTELLVLDKHSFILLMKGSEGLPLTFLKTLDIFQDFPCEVLSQNPDSIVTKYFPKDKIILWDISDTSWLHIVKTGCAYVVRMQTLINQQNNKYLEQRKVGFTKTGSHSKAMLGLADRQRKARVRLPPISRVNQLTHTLGVEPNSKYLSTSSSISSTNSVPLTKQRSQALELKIRLRTPEPQQRGNSLNKDLQAQVLLGSDFFTKQRKAEEREAYVILDTLQVGSIIGLQEYSFIEEVSLSKSKKDFKKYLTVVSCGAEIVQISKRLFVQHAANNTILKLQTLIKEYASLEDVKNLLYTKENWQMYKNALMKKTIANHGLSL